MKFNTGYLRVDAGIDSRFSGSSFGSRQGMSDDHSELFEERITRPRAKRAPASGTIAQTKRESISASTLQRNRLFHDHLHFAVEPEVGTVGGGLMDFDGENVLAGDDVL